MPRSVLRLQSVLAARMETLANREIRGEALLFGIESN